VEAVALGQADAIIGDEQVVYYYLYKNGWSGRVKKSGRPLYIGQCCMGVSSTNQVLLSLLTKGVDRARGDGVIGRIEHNGWEWNILRSGFRWCGISGML